jgi:CRP-like cAMP-binding protein
MLPIKEIPMTDFTNCKLFAGIPIKELDTFITKTTLRAKNYSRGEIIAFEGDICTSLGLIVSGEISIQQLLPSGKKIVIDTLSAGDSFGEVIIFSDQKTYPASVEASAPSQIVFITRENVLHLCMLSTPFLNNFVGLLSNKVLMLNRKVKSLSFRSPRQKTINFILENYREQKTLLLHCRESRREMAEKLGLPRPSLSRELIKMKEFGWIDFEGSIIKILDIEKLEDGLKEVSI